ncbi:GlxA family transcriptional regulator [Roseovarius litorisediminis]|nr:GlxA family transcriptional regulator [Roseovarius litorisediminis]
MPEWTKHHSAPVSIGFLIFDQFSNLCLANCLEPLRAANTQTLKRAFDWQILTSDGAPVLSSSGMQVVPHAPLAALKPCDYLFITASYDHDRHDTRATRQALQRASRRAQVTVGLDAGPWLMASAGLLNGRRATVHWDLLDGFTEAFLGVEAEQARVVRDGPMMTCAGAMSALDLTMGLINDHLGMSARLDVEALFIHGDPPVGSNRDQKAVSDPLVSRALALMRNNLEYPLSQTILARHLSCQPRTLDRRFRAALGAPPGTVYRHLRLASARKMLEGTNLSIAEIGLRCGYDSPAAMTRAMRRQYGATPSELRRSG